MRHYGDITKINGSEIEPVNAIIGGSPCQDVSVAGKRAGLAGERSGLFMEQIRILKEMREKYGKPRYMVWENVPGAFSSNNGEDFRTVLEETAHVVDKTAVIPRPPRGKWTTAGAVVGDGWSIAWRVFDAQFWGVPQRRRRIALVADFGGLTAPEILFERESVPGGIDESGAQGKGTAAAAEIGIDTANIKCLNPWDCQSARTLDGNGGSPACNQGGMAIVPAAGFKYRNGAKARSIDYHVEKQTTLGTDGNEVVCIEMTSTKNTIVEDGVCPTLTARMGTGGNQVNAVYSIDRAAYNQGINAKYNVGISDDGKAQTLVTKGLNAVYTASHGGFMTDVSTNVANTLQATDYKDPAFVCSSQSIVRRLTPLECERLQGYPDHWTDIGEWTDSKGKKHKAADSPRYKALGNSIALPNWVYVLRKLMICCGADLTMGSLFDGIGGFPLIWQSLGGAPVWASEIEEFCIAVTKLRFGGA